MRVTKKNEGQELMHRPSVLTERWDDMERMFGRMFDEFWQRPHFDLIPEFWPRGNGISAPAVDVYEEKNAVVVKAELPGIEKDEVEVNVNESLLTIRGEKKKEEEVKDTDYYRMERSHGMFSRSVALPVEVDAAGAKAKFSNGVLEVRIPKAPTAKGKSRKLQIQ